MKTYIIFQPSPLIASLCSSMLDTTCYREEVRVRTGAKGRRKTRTGAGWEVTLR